MWYNFVIVYCTQLLTENAGALDFCDKLITFDKLIISLSFYTLLFIIACFMEGVGNMTACLLVNLITNFIAGFRGRVEYTSFCYYSHSLSSLNSWHTA